MRTYPVVKLYPQNSLGININMNIGNNLVIHAHPQTDREYKI
jgi:hypothetical protein